MGLEQSLNRDSKTSGGFVGFTLKRGAVDRWFLTAHEKSLITAATKSCVEFKIKVGNMGIKSLQNPESEGMKMTSVLL